MVKEFGKYYMLMYEHYNDIKSRFMLSYRRATGELMDEDVFHDTLIKCAETLTEELMENMSYDSLVNYTYIAFKTNMFREKCYSRNKYKVTIDIDECLGLPDTTEYWDMRCGIKDFIVSHFDVDTFEECCEWIIDRKSVPEIEKAHNDKNLYYKFKKIKAMVIKEFGDDLRDIPTP